MCNIENYINCTYYKVIMISLHMYAIECLGFHNSILFRINK